MLIAYTDIQPRLNIDLSSPNGQTLATSLIASVQAWASRIVDFPIESAEVTEYFDDGHQRLWLNTSAPVSNLTISQYNTITSQYDAIDSAFVRHAGNQVYVTTPLPSGFQIVKATYTTGWTSATVPDQLKDALIELVGLKIQEATNYSANPDDPAGDGSGPPTGALKRVEAIDYVEEYFSGTEAQWKAKAAQLSRTLGDSVPASILETVSSYRRPFAL